MKKLDFKLRVEIIRSKLESAIDTIMVLEENLPDNFRGFSDSRLVRDAVYKEIESVIEYFLDICAVINSDLRLGAPETEDTILDHFEKEKIFDKRIIELIREMKRFRNILVHKYGEVNDKMAYNTIKEGLSDLDLVVGEIEKFLKRRK